MSPNIFKVNIKVNVKDISIAKQTEHTYCYIEHRDWSPLGLICHSDNDFGYKIMALLGNQITY